MTGLQCRVQLQIGVYGKPELRGPWAAPTHREVWIGRGAESGLWIPEEWVPTALARLLPGPSGSAWLIQNGSRARMQVQNPYVDKHDFAPRAMVALQEGGTQISWPDLDDICRLGVTIGVGVADGLEELENGRLVRDLAGTDYAAHSVSLTDKQRSTMAVLFAHLLLGTPAPDNLAVAAGKALGRGPQAITMMATDLRARINKWRWLDLHDTAQLGHYLVGTTRMITRDDLPPSYLRSFGPRDGGTTP